MTHTVEIVIERMYISERKLIGDCDDFDRDLDHDPCNMVQSTKKRSNKL